MMMIVVRRQKAARNEGKAKPKPVERLMRNYELALAGLAGQLDYSRRIGHADASVSQRKLEA
jgi:hypothetical protein